MKPKSWHFTKQVFGQKQYTKRNGILLPKIVLIYCEKKCSTDRAKFLRSLEQFIQAVKGQTIFL